MNTSSIPTYQAECAKTKNRGLLICIEGGSIAFGTRTLCFPSDGVKYTNNIAVISYWLNYGTPPRTTPHWTHP